MTTVLSLRKEDAFSKRLNMKKIKVICCPLIETAALDAHGNLQLEISRLDYYDGVFLTSSAAAKILVKASKGEGLDRIGKIYALGENSRRMLLEVGLKPANYGAANTAEEMLEAIGFSELRGKRFLYLCGDRSLRVIPERLKDVAEVRECVVYRTINLMVADKFRKEIERKLKSDSTRLACFFSPSAVASFAEQFTARDFYTAAIGQTTGDALKKHGFDVKLVSPAARAGVFADAVAEYLEKDRGRLD